MAEIRQTLHLTDLNLEEVNRVLIALQDRLDEQEGRRGTPVFYSAPDFQNNRLSNVKQGESSGEALTADLEDTDLEVLEGNLRVKVATDQGLQRTSEGIGVKVNSAWAIQINETSGLQAKVKNSGGILIDEADGLYTDPTNIDHGSLAGLGDDDHGIYHTDARALTWHNGLVGAHVTNGDSHDHSGGDGAQIDHGGLAGLADDDHAQYLDTTRHDTPNRHGDSVVFSTTWIDYSGTSTVTGWSAFVTKTIYYKKIGKTVLVEYYISGTSNATTASFTLPFAAAAGSQAITAVRVIDNGVALTTPGLGFLNGSTLYTGKNFSTTGGFTASGDKYIIGQFFYEASS